MNNKEIIQMLLDELQSVKNRDKVWMREQSSQTTYAQGRLNGACMVLDLDIVETKTEIIIVTRKARKVYAQVRKWDGKGI